MKRILKFGGALLALGMLLASCNMLTSDSTVSGNSTEQESSNINGITIGINDIVSTDRTILPVDWTDVKAGKLTYVLWKKTSGDESAQYAVVKSFSYTELKEKTATVNIELKKWDLKLVGYISATGSSDLGPNYNEGKPTLEGFLNNQDFTTGIKAITFDLKPIDPEKTTTTATGSINVEIAWLTTKPKRLELGVYLPSKTTADIINDTDRSNNAVLSKNADDADFTGTDETVVHTYTWEEEDKLDAGMYKFAAVFYDATSGGNIIGYYIDYLYVDGGNLSQATINYGDKFNTTPENPTWLAVETYFKPIEGNEDTEADEYKYYFAKFHWNDISNNETGFELVIKEGSNDEIPLDSSNFVVGSYFYTTSWYNGTTDENLTNTNTLDAGKTWVVLKLETGKLYTAKIRAINDFTPAFAAATNPTDFCKNLNRNGDGNGRSYAPIVGDDKQFGMFVVNYALDDGQVNKKDNSSTDPRTVKNYIMGYNYSSEQQYLMNRNKLAKPYITKQGHVFDHWETTDTSSTEVSVIEKKQHANMALKPVWSGAEAYVGVTFPSYADAVDVKIADKQNPDNTVIFDPKKESSISVTSGESLTVTNDSFVLTDPKGAVLDKDVTSNGISIATKKWTWTPAPTSLPPAGFYCLQITGTYEDAGTGKTLKLCGNVYINVVN